MAEDKVATEATGAYAIRPIGRDGLRVLVQRLEAFDGTPIVDVKPVLTGGGEAALR